MQTIPLQATPSQQVTVQLENQVCQIAVKQRSTGVFLDLYVNNTPIVLGALCENLNLLVRSAYLGFLGDLIFLDQQGTSDPTYTGFGPGARFVLAYLTVDDLETIGISEG